jgi:hypothetical protein
VSVQIQTPEAVEREWWARLPRLLVAPAEVLAELRDESREAADARQEPLVAVTILAGVAMFVGLVALEPPFKHTDIDFSIFNLVLETILGGALVALSNFWFGGALVYLGTRGLGALSGYRLSRHLAGLATAPFVLLLVSSMPVRLALYGIDVFKAEGSDAGAGGDVFIAIDALFLVWTLVLLLVGIKLTQRWSWGRAAAALGVSALFAILLGTFAFAVSAR